MSDFYCSEKFTWLTVDLEKRSTNSCCASPPVKVDLQWLEENPGKLFNTPMLKQERQDMLNNIPVASCELECWIPEKNNLVSRRLKNQTTKKTHVDVNASPDTINIIVGSTCNLTCSYCCKNYSTAWTRDIINNGPYTLGSDRYTLSDTDKIITKISHNEHERSAGYQLLLSEISKFKHVDNVTITGGEPFLYGSLVEMVRGLEEAKKEIIIYTGLGVSKTRLQTILSNLQSINNLKIVVSAENTNRLYEFNRYGNKFQDFCDKLKIIREYNINIKFSAVLSNITLPGLLEFNQYFPEYAIDYTLCNDPVFLQVNVLDDDTKNSFIKILPQLRMSQELHSLLAQTIQQPYSNQQKTNLANYLQEFSSRRNLSLDIFPSKFINWLYK